MKAVWIALAFSATGCGLRSTPEGPLLCADDGDSGTDDGGEDRAGSCASPIDLPYGTPLTVRGKLGGCSEAAGWCGADGGPEDVYRLPKENEATEDVVVSFRADETSSSPTLRVVHDDGTDGTFDPCADPPLAPTEVCAASAETRDTWVFNRGAGDTYIIVDSAGQVSGAEYAFDVAYFTAAVPDDCPKMDDVITLGIGGVFVWDDTLAREQGYLDGKFCNAPGSEHTWMLQLKQPGLLKAVVEAHDDRLEPIASVRTSCAGSREVACDNTSSAEGSSSLGVSLDAGSYLLTVDQQSVSGGAYTLTVSLD